MEDDVSANSKQEKECVDDISDASNEEQNKLQTNLNIIIGDN